MTTAEHVKAAREHLFAAVQVHPKADQMDRTTRLLMLAWRLLKAVR